MIFSHPLVIVTLTVLLGVMSAVVLKEASSHPSLSLLEIGLIFLVVMLINGLKFILWGIAHRKHPISLTYPLNSLFFPLIFLVSYIFYGEPASLNKIVGILLIVSGVAAITYFDDPSSEKRDD